MAKKTEFIVIDGCIQEGKARYLPGQSYTPPNADLRAELLAGGVIAEVKDPIAQAVLRAAASKAAAQPAVGGGDEGDEGEGGEGEGGNSADLLNQGGGS